MVNNHIYIFYILISPNYQELSTCSIVMLTCNFVTLKKMDVQVHFINLCQSVTKIIYSKVLLSHLITC